MINKHLTLINIVGLTKGLISGKNTPFIHSLLNEYKLKSLSGVFPSVTTTAQSAMLTGKDAKEHGIVGNGWYFHEHAEVGFWKQANNLVQAPQIWQKLKENNADFTCANSFWWYNMYSSVDYSITPRPHYPADGRKIPDLYSFPAGLHETLEAEIGKFPFFNFWGPKAGIESSQWIADAAIGVQRKHNPNLHLIYLPQLDYNLQKVGPNHPKIAIDLKAIDHVVKKLCNQLTELNTEFVIVSEYGIRSVDTPVHINRILRENQYLEVRESLGFELLDCGASKAFAAADHQVAHIYINDTTQLANVKQLLLASDGIEKVLDKEEQKELGINHARSGDLLAIADENAWFTYYYWLDDNKAPDFARTIDIHRKPGYDPVEMFFDSNISMIKLKILWKLLLKKLGFRMLLNVIPLTAELIKGSHGRLEVDEDYQPLIISRLLEVKNCKNLKDVFYFVESYFDSK
jgi:predicted AlkP superfamily pyrophosphatase or phosphodiesterase